VKLLNQHQPVRISQNVPIQYYGQGGDYPGISQVTPFFPEMQTQFLPAVAKPATSGILSNLNFKDIKGFIDRMGGIEGLMNTVTKVQKMMQTFQQVAPMLKLLLPKLGAKSTSVDDDDNAYNRRRRMRRRRRRRKTSSSRHSSYSRGKALRARPKSKRRKLD
jgi:hypothetical protein